MPNDFVRNLLIEQRRRVVGSIMSYAETEILPAVPPVKRKEFRDKVLASVGAYHDVCLDVLKASINDGFITNEEVLTALRDIHSDVKKLDGH